MIQEESSLFNDNGRIFFDDDHMGRSFRFKVEQPHANRLHVINVINVHKALPKRVEILSIFFP
jgi:hypothetical protein